jgi:protein-S-isoprenylcysteine O-methyltransferase Ste14
MAAGMAQTSRGSGAIGDQLSTHGDVLFRWRSYMPLLLVPLFALSVSDNRAPNRFSWELFCFAVALCGLLLRGLVIGTAPQGTSARGTRQPTADLLMTSGAYSLVRHPLYLANTIMWVGCALLSRTWYLPLIVVLLSFVYHERIAAREETFLESRFGNAFHEWTRAVPATIPRMTGYRPSGVRFQGRKAFMQESHGLFALGTAFAVLDAVEASLRLHTPHVDSRWLGVWAATAVPFLFVLVTKQAARRARKPS